MKLSQDQLKVALKERGIAMDVGGCGCCGSPWLKVAIDDVVVYDADDASFDMIPKENNDAAR